MSYRFQSISGAHKTKVMLNI